MRYLLLLIIIFFPLKSISQSMIMSGNGNILMHDGAKIIFLNATPNNIQKIGTLGGIRTLGENSEIIFKNVNQAGTYMIPFVSSSGTTIPFTFEIQTNGSNPGDIHFSSWETDLNNNPLPTGVTHITDMSGLDNSSKVINRFWKIDHVGFTIRPKGEYEFTYHINDLNGTFINESGLTAQRWNSDDLLWGDWLYGQTANTATKKVNILVQNPEDEYSIWTLVDIADPLPIELVRFVTNCKNGLIEWTTYTEINSSHFELQYSDDAVNWSTYEIIPSSGFSNQPINYSIPNPNFRYYRLKSIDLDETFEYSNIIINDCIEFESFNISINPNPFTNFVSVYNNNRELMIQVYESSGKLVYHNMLDIGEHLIDLSNISSGIYTFKLSNSIESQTKIIIKI